MHWVTMIAHSLCFREEPDCMGGTYPGTEAAADAGVKMGDCQHQAFLLTAESIVGMITLAGNKPPERMSDPHVPGVEPGRR